MAEQKESKQGKIILWKSDSNEGIAIFVADGGGLRDYRVNGIEETINVVSDLIKNSNYNIKDIQNGIIDDDFHRIAFYHYISCYPSLEESSFNYLIDKLKINSRTKIFQRLSINIMCTNQFFYRNIISKRKISFFPRKIIAI